MRTLMSLLVMVIPLASLAQYEPSVLMYWNHLPAVNPAASGLLYKHQGSVGWARTPGKGIHDPWLVRGSYDMKWKKIHGGTGLDLDYSELGYSKYYAARIRYAYHQALKNGSTVSAGLSAGRYYESTDFSYFHPIDPDPMLESGVKTTGYYSFAAGLMFNNKWVNLGISTRKMYTNSLENPGQARQKNISVTASGNIRLTSSLVIRPQVFIQATEFSTAFYHLNILTIYKKLIWAGVSYLNIENTAVMAGADLYKKYRIGYAWTFRKNATFSEGSNHSVVFSVMIPDSR